MGAFFFLNCIVENRFPTFFLTRRHLNENPSAFQVEREGFLLFINGTFYLIFPTLIKYSAI